MTPENIILTGDCVEVMAGLDAESVDAIVTDPPYDLLTTSRNGSRRINNPDNPAGRAARGFMGKTWDGTGVAFRPETWERVLRIAKPGAHLLAFGGTRTYHRLACAIEDAGWEIRDCLVWAYASGFPKSLNVSIAIDKALGATREVVGQRHVSNAAQGKGLGHGDLVTGTVRAGEIDVTAPATPEAAEWQGWGTALKPAWEPIVLARKPLRGTVAANVLRYRTGALNIDASRIPFVSTLDAAAAAAAAQGYFAAVQAQGDLEGPAASVNERGRWPANLVLTDPIFDGDTPGVVGGGETASGLMKPTPVTGGQRTVFGQDALAGYTTIETYGDSGTYSRFFLIPKADRGDREPVLGGLPRSTLVQTVALGEMEYATLPNGDRREPQHPKPRANHHPTVKPTDLMRHLVRLVTPAGGLVLDPFLGSGTTALACELEGFRWLGIEKEPEYVAIAEARLNGTQRGLGLVG